jgi:hypothetical protein
MPNNKSGLYTGFGHVTIKTDREIKREREQGKRKKWGINYYYYYYYYYRGK